MIEIICGYPHNLVMGASALIGAGVYAAYSIYEARKELKCKFKLEINRLLDTAWQSIATGVAAGIAIGCGWSGIFIAMLSGIGIDKITNKFKINKTNILNIVQLIAKLTSRLDKK